MEVRKGKKDKGQSVGFSNYVIKTLPIYLSYIIKLYVDNEGIINN